MCCVRTTASAPASGIGNSSPWQYRFMFLAAVPTKSMNPGWRHGGLNAWRNSRWTGLTGDISFCASMKRRFSMSWCSVSRAACALYPVSPTSLMQRLPLPETIPPGVEVWRLRLNLQMPIQAQDLSLLSREEHLRALRFRRHEDRVRAVATRAALRRLLAMRMRRSPESLCFAVNPHGKPRLDGETGLEFNVSHAGCYALIALSSLWPIG